MKKIYTKVLSAATILFISTQSLSAQDPTTAAPAPTHAAENVLSIFSDAYATNLGFTLKGNTVNKTSIREFTFDEETDKMLFYDKALNTHSIHALTLNQAADVTKYEFIHFDVFVPASPFTIRVRLGDNTGFLTPGQDAASLSLGWNSIDVDLSLATFKDVDYSQFKVFDYWVVGGQQRTIFVDNIYLYNRTPVSINEDASASLDVKIADNKLYAQSGNTITELRIVSLAGATVETVKANSSQIELDINNLQSGVYLVQVATQDGNLVVKKIVKN